MEQYSTMADVVSIIWSEISGCVREHYLEVFLRFNEIVIYAENYDIDVCVNFINRLRIKEYRKKIFIYSDEKTYNAILKYADSDGIELSHIDKDGSDWNEVLKSCAESVVYFNSHVHSLDGWYTESMMKSGLCKIFVYTRKANDLYEVLDLPRHIQGIHIYMQLVEWFDQSKLAEEYRRPAMKSQA